MLPENTSLKPQFPASEASGDSPFFIGRSLLNGGRLVTRKPSTEQTGSHFLAKRSCALQVNLP